ncbi:hypothetical protein M9H77_19037 [Catharanthus roseus]|uniref:Uncharacterized protein n=1 Tax=Catharanthus roseus TaxID=4058 RepID=A0ACC0B946_CATRO|nr:hypothetical protein M9H77_19037 [Catharanthus roseus]
MALASEINHQKWEGKAVAKLKNGVKAEQIWSLLTEDFCNFDKWLPTIDTCHQIEGDNGKPGLIRYCSSSSSTKWCQEKLIAIDPKVRCLSYEILSNNLGFKSYVSTIKVLKSTEIGGDSEEEEELGGGCEIEWSFVADPVDGLSCEGLGDYINYSLKGMVENMEKALFNQMEIN